MSACPLCSNGSATIQAVIDRDAILPIVAKDRMVDIADRLLKLWKPLGT